MNATQAENVIFVRGTNFNTLDDGIVCAFKGHQNRTSATILSESLLSCPIPVEVNEDEVVQIAVGLQGSIHIPEVYVDVISIDSPTSSNGTIMSHNTTLCEPGTFQPQNGQGHCLPCPVGFICPEFGIARPILCPAGSICEQLGLIMPSSPCTSGHYCNNGTKMSSQIVLSTTDTWLLEEESGVLTTVMSNSAWNYTPRQPPATGERRISHPPIDVHVTAEQPYPCPVGYYCKEGVSSVEHREDDYTTPQKCFDGYFCSRQVVRGENRAYAFEIGPLI